MCMVAAAGVTVPPPGVEAPLPWVDPHAAPDRRRGPEEHQGTVRRRRQHAPRRILSLRTLFLMPCCVTLAQV